MKIHQILINDSNKLPEELPKFHNFCFDQIRKIYPDADYHLYSGEEIEEIIKNNFDEDVFISYKKLKPYACKADLARLCLLYLYGGLYIDLNIYFMNPIPNLDNLEFFAFRDLPELSQQSWAVQNGIMYSLPKSLVVKNTIELIVKHCKHEYYGIQCVDVSATTVLGFGIMNSMPNYNILTNGQLDKFMIDIFDEKTKNKLQSIGYTSNILLGFIMDDGKLISLRKPSGGGDIESMGFVGTNNYVKMWAERKIFDTSVKFPENNLC